MAGKIRPTTTRPPSTQSQCELGNPDLFGQAISAADWHNTMTGHNVSVAHDSGDGWDLTNDGWQPYDKVW